MNTSPDEVDRILDDPRLGVYEKEEALTTWMRARLLMAANPNGYHLQVRKMGSNPYYPWRATILRRTLPTWTDTYVTQAEALEEGFRVLKLYLPRPEGNT